MVHQPVVVKVSRAEPAVRLPIQMSVGASGYDLHAFLSSPLTLHPGERTLIPTGLRVALPCGYEAQVRPRSGLALEAGITLLNTPGTIDSDYRGEIQVLMIHLGQKPYTITPEERLAQLVVCPVIHVVFEEGVLEETQRGVAGFGSTGA